jgi:hypothetical protein
LHTAPAHNAAAENAGDWRNSRDAGPLVNVERLEQGLHVRLEIAARYWLGAPVSKVEFDFYWTCWAYRLYFPVALVGQYLHRSRADFVVGLREVFKRFAPGVADRSLVCSPARAGNETLLNRWLFTLELPHVGGVLLTGPISHLCQGQLFTIGRK